MAYCFRLIAVLFLSLISFNSFALIPTVAGLRVLSISNPSFSVPDTVFSDVDAAIDWAISTHQHLYPYEIYPDSVKSDRFNVWSSQGRIATVHLTSAASCPANSTASGSQCSCNEGYEEKNGNSCEKPKEPDTCENIASTCSGFKSERMPRFEVYYSGSSPSGACSGAPISGCSKGCYLEFTGVSVYYKDQDGKSVASGSAVFTGDSCDHSEEASEPDPEKACKAGEFPGTVNGTKVCLPAKSKETEHQPKTENNADGSSSKTTSTVSCADGKCTVTETTTTKDSEGNVTGVSSGSTSYGESDFCQKNPASGVCSGNGSGDEEGEGKGSFGGSCSSGFTCEGDAATCAIAKEQHRMNCELVDSNNPFSELFESARGTGLGVEELDFDLFSDLSFDSIIGSGTCPADIEINVFGRSVYFKFSVYCPYFAILGNLLVLGAIFGAFRTLGSS